MILSIFRALVLVTAAVLRIDQGDYLDARARLADAAAVLSRERRGTQKTPPSATPRPR